MFSFHVLCLLSCKHEDWLPRIQGVAKDWFIWLNENLSQETVFLATTL